MTPLHVVLMAGEPSGDQLGASLMRSLKTESPVPLCFYGVGGPEMQKEGLESFFSVKELSVMGITEALTQIKRLLQRLKEAVHFIKDLNPAIVVTIDFPGFNLKLAKKIKPLGIPLIHYVAPTVWAWRSGRAQTFAAIFDHLLALFPFEPSYFEPHHLPTTFVGHRVVEQGNPPEGDVSAFLTTHGLPSGSVLLTLLPGSRSKEVKTLLPIFQDTLQLLRTQGMPVAAVIPTRPEVSQEVRTLLDGWTIPFCVVETEADKQEAYAASKAALAASGTVALELAWAGLPMVIGYKVGRLSAFIAKRLLKTPYVCMVNILTNQGVVPELLQECCNPVRLAKALRPLLEESPERRAQKEAMRETVRVLKPSSGTPSQRAAQVILSYLMPHYSRGDL